MTEKLSCIFIHSNYQPITSAHNQLSFRQNHWLILFADQIWPDLTSVCQKIATMLIDGDTECLNESLRVSYVYDWTSRQFCPLYIKKSLNNFTTCVLCSWCYMKTGRFSFLISNLVWIFADLENVLVSLSISSFVPQEVISRI